MCDKLQCAKDNTQRLVLLTENKTVQKLVGHLEEIISEQTGFIKYFKNQSQISYEGQHGRSATFNTGSHKGKQQRPQFPAGGTAGISHRGSAANPATLPTTIKLQNAQPNSGISAMPCGSDVGGSAPVMPNADDKQITTQQITTKHIASAVLQAETQAKMDEIINLEDNDGFQPYVNRKRRRNAPIIGQKVNSAGSALKIPRQVSFLHVYKLHPETTPDDVLSIIKPVCPEAECDIINSKYPKLYSSFKVTVNKDNIDKALNPSVWSMGTYFNRFFHRNRLTNQTR